jgi:hypothetical protein
MKYNAKLVNLDSHQATWLRRLSKKTKMPVSALIRCAVDMWLEPIKAGDESKLPYNFWSNRKETLEQAMKREPKQ